MLNQFLSPKHAKLADIVNVFNFGEKVGLVSNNEVKVVPSEFLKDNTEHTLYTTDIDM